MNRFVVFLFGMLFSIGLIIGGFYFYLQKTNQDFKLDVYKKKVIDTNKEKDLSLDNNIVKELVDKYDLNSVSCNEIGRVGDFIKNNKIKEDKINRSHKMYLAYRQLSVSKVLSSTCESYSGVWNTNTNTKLGCGSNYQGGDTDHYANTSVIKEKDLKESYENIFGKNTYNQIDFFAINYDLSYDNSIGNLGYSFDYINKAYVLTSSTETTNCKIPNTELISAKTKGDTLSITRLITSPNNVETSYELTLKYSFKKKDNKYYLEEIEKIGE